MSNINFEFIEFGECACEEERPSEKSKSDRIENEIRKHKFQLRRLQ